MHLQSAALGVVSRRNVKTVSAFANETEPLTLFLLPVFAHKWHKLARETNA